MWKTLGYTYQDVLFCFSSMVEVGPNLCALLFDRVPMLHSTAVTIWLFCSPRPGKCEEIVLCLCQDLNPRLSMIFIPHHKLPKTFGCLKPFNTISHPRHLRGCFYFLITTFPWKILACILFTQVHKKDWLRLSPENPLKLVKQEWLL